MTKRIRVVKCSNGSCIHAILNVEHVHWPVIDSFFDPICQDLCEHKNSIGLYNVHKQTFVVNGTVPINLFVLANSSTLLPSVP